MYDANSPHVDPSMWETIAAQNIPVFVICYGMQELAFHFQGEVQPSADREYGRAMIEMTEENKSVAELLFAGVEHSQMWMSHGDKVTRMPEGFLKIAHTANSEHAAIANPAKRLFGLQFHPEVTHSLGGMAILKNFVEGVCSAPTDWNMKDIAEEFIKEVSFNANAVFEFTILFLSLCLLLIIAYYLCVCNCLFVYVYIHRFASELVRKDM